MTATNARRKTTSSAVGMEFSASSINFPDEAGSVAGLWRNRRDDCMECVYPSVVRHGTFGDPLRLREHLAFVGDKNAGDPVPTAQEVLSGLYMQLVGTRNEEP
jgi:hypothetical protein